MGFKKLPRSTSYMTKEEMHHSVVKASQSYEQVSMKVHTADRSKQEKNHPIQLHTDCNRGI